LNVAQFMAVVLGLVIGNAAVLIFSLNPRMTNGFFFGALIFFLLAQSPRKTIGFALTLRDWGDKWRDWLDLNPEAETATCRDRRKAAHRSIVVLNLFVLVGWMSIWIRPSETGHAMQTDLSCQLGIWLGFLTGYLVAIGRRETSP